MHLLSKQNIPEEFTLKTIESGAELVSYDDRLQQFLCLPQNIREEVIQAIRQELGEDQTLDGALLGSYCGGVPISIQGDGIFSTSDLNDTAMYLYLSSPKLKMFGLSPEHQTSFWHFVFGDECVNLHFVELVLGDFTTLTLQGVSPTIKLTKGISKPKYTSVTIQGGESGCLVFKDVVRIDRLSLIDSSNIQILSNQPFLSIGHVELINSSVFSGLPIVADSGYQCEKSKSSVSIMNSTKSEIPKLQGYQTLTNYDLHKFNEILEGPY